MSDQFNNQNKNLFGLQNGENGLGVLTSKTEILSQHMDSNFGKKLQVEKEMSKIKIKCFTGYRPLDPHKGFSKEELEFINHV